MPLAPGIGLYLQIISRILEQHANNQLQSRNLTFSQSKLLMILGDSAEHTASMKELEEQFHSAQSTICGIVNRLEKKGLVEALPSGNDKRVKRVRLTDAGEAQREGCISDIQEHEAWIATALTGEEEAQLKALLLKILTEKWHSGVICKDDAPPD